MSKTGVLATKPNCSPLCDHTQVCKFCHRVRCIDNMSHNRLTGYSCVCNSKEWIPLSGVAEKDRFVLSWDTIEVETQAPARFTVRQLYHLVCQLPTSTQAELVRQLLMQGGIYDSIKLFVNSG